jgi:hypothetical protein
MGKPTSDDDVHCAVFPKINNDTIQSCRHFYKLFTIVEVMLIEPYLRVPLKELKTKKDHGLPDHKTDHFQKHGPEAAFCGFFMILNFFGHRDIFTSLLLLTK